MWRLRIAELAKHKSNWSLRDLSDEIDEDYQTICYWNQGRSFPPLYRAIELCQFFECTLEQLIEMDPGTHHVIYNNTGAAEEGLKRWAGYIQLHRNEPNAWADLVQRTLRILDDESVS